MTEWTIRQARHIPDDELHAYLDQALSRSQCAEIETHLSACRICQGQRAAVAGLRDRTTALLSGLTPRPVIVPPSYQLLREQQSRLFTIAVWQSRLSRAGLWAAGVAAAVGAGWVARSVLDPHSPSSSTIPLAQAAAAPTAAPAVPEATETTEAIERQANPAPIPERRPVGLVVRPASQRSFEPLVPAPTLQLASAIVPVGFSNAPEPRTPASVASRDPFGGIWRVVSWEEALQMAGSGLPFIEGIPVIGVLFQPGTSGERPTVIVAQQDPGGEIIQSIEGPVSKVTELLRRQSSPDLHASESARTPPDYVEGPSGMRRALRVLTVTGRLPVDSLNALARIATIR